MEIHGGADNNTNLLLLEVHSTSTAGISLSGNGTDSKDLMMRVALLIF